MWLFSPLSLSKVLEVVSLSWVEERAISGDLDSRRSRMSILSLALSTYTPKHLWAEARIDSHLALWQSNDRSPCCVALSLSQCVVRSSRVRDALPPSERLLPLQLALNEYHWSATHTFAQC